MLRINLLPPERRRLHRTPLFALIPLILGAALLAGSLAATATFFVQMRQIEQEIELTQKAYDALAADELKHKDLTAKLAQIKAEIGNLQAVVASKGVDWSEILSALVEVSSKNPAVWFDRIDILQGVNAQAALRRFDPNSRASSEYALQLECNVAPELVVEEGEKYYVGNHERIFKFRTDLRNHHLLRDHFPQVWPTNPDWQEVQSAQAEEKFYLKFSAFLIAVRK